MKTCNMCHKEKDDNKFSEGRNQCNTCRNKQNPTKICISCGEKKSTKEFDKKRKKCRLCMENPIRTCIKCKIEKPKENFRKKQNQDICKECINEEEKQRRFNDVDNEKKRLNDHIKREYGITLEEYNIMLVKQNGVCAICFKPENPKVCKRLSIDHDHETGKVRGLLCRKCNSLLGFVNDSVLHLRSAINYLEKN